MLSLDFVTSVVMYVLKMSLLNMLIFYVTLLIKNPKEKFCFNIQWIP